MNRERATAPFPWHKTTTRAMDQKQARFYPENGSAVPTPIPDERSCKRMPLGQPDEPTMQMFFYATEERVADL